MISKLITILILTNSSKNFKYYKRCIKYHQNFQYKIVIIDSSNKKRKLIDKNVEIYNIKNKDIYHRLLFGVKKIKTRYVLWLGDDDFLIESTLDKCQDVLKKKKYNLVSGQFIKFQEKNFNLEDYNSNNFFFNLRKIEKFQNIRYSIENFNVSFKIFNPHSVLNKSILKKSLLFFLKYKYFKPYAYFDKIISIFFLMEGKIKLIRDLYQLRSSGTGQWQNKKNFVKKKDDYFFSSTIYDLYDLLKNNNYFKNKIKKKINYKTWKNFLLGIKFLAIEEKENHENQTFLGNLFNDYKNKFFEFEKKKIINYNKHLIELKKIKKLVITR